METAANLNLLSTITCPNCGHQVTETMPTDACVGFYTCAGCGQMLRPKAGDCCVFCSYGTVACPPIQEERASGSFSGCCPGGADPCADDASHK
ncbi:GDCCVxC domain-containing (seleno)protein [Hyphomicrobium sp.]|uniref:GDCCVxC domain-containing (seleno)protein n=1 Tax=Hyphomicrobium sp. TaxID=82 RepID=UPI0025BC7724|nr:GDCCVxC domain-containing (seleno)protein [Hyphomicrobium sp.]